MNRMKSWTLKNEYGDSIEKFTTRIDLRNAQKNKPTHSFSYFGVLNGERVYGHLNKVKKAFNDYRNKKTKWEEVWE